MIRRYFREGFGGRRWYDFYRETARVGGFKTPPEAAAEQFAAALTPSVLRIAAVDLRDTDPDPRLAPFAPMPPDPVAPPERTIQELTDADPDTLTDREVRRLAQDVAKRP